MDRHTAVAPGGNVYTSEPLEPEQYTRDKPRGDLTIVIMIRRCGYLHEPPSTELIYTGDIMLPALVRYRKAPTYTQCSGMIHHSLVDGQTTGLISGGGRGSLQLSSS